MKKAYKFTEAELLDTPYTGNLVVEELDIQNTDATETAEITEEFMDEDLETKFKKGLEKVAVDGKIHELEDISTLNGILNKILQSNIQQRRTLKPGQQYLPLNILIIGDAGTGKSSIINDWIKNAQYKGKTFRRFKMNGSQLNADQVQGVGHAVHTDVDDPEKPGEKKPIDYADYLTFKTFDRLNPEDPSVYGSIFFIDELNRSYEDARAALLDMITSHEIADSSSDTNAKYLSKWIMTVAAMNPPDKAHKGTVPLDLAMLTRFYVFDWKGSIKGTREYLLGDTQDHLDQAEENLAAGVDPTGEEYDKSDYNADIRRYKGQQEIIKAVMTPKLVYDSGDTLKTAQKNQKPVLNSRTVEAAIKDCDGTKEDFLRLLQGHCGISKDSAAYKAMASALDTTSKDTDLGVKARITNAYDALMEFEDNL